MVSKIYAWRHTKTDMTQADPKALEDRDRRARLPDTRDNTGRLLGDPPPGRSALDKKREAEKPKAADWLADALAQAKDEVTADE